MCDPHFVWIPQLEFHSLDTFASKDINLLPTPVVWERVNWETPINLAQVAKEKGSKLPLDF